MRPAAADDLIESAAGSHQYETTARVMCRAARAAGDVLAEGRARAVLAEALLESGRLPEAEEEARLAGELAESVQDDAAVSRAADSLGLIRLHQGRYAESRRCLERVIKGFRAAGDRSSEATALCNLSRVLLVMGDTEPAVTAAQHGLALHSASGNTVRRAAAHHALGVAAGPAGMSRPSTHSFRHSGHSATTSEHGGREPPTSASRKPTWRRAVGQRPPGMRRRPSSSGASVATGRGPTS